VNPTEVLLAGILASPSLEIAFTKSLKEYIYHYTTYQKESVYDMPVYRYRHHLVGLNSIISQGETNDLRIMRMIHGSGASSNSLEEIFATKH
jgi:hypothetical protein